MPLKTIKYELYKAKENHYAIPLFDVFEMQGARGVFEAVVEKKAPAIVAIYSHLIDLPDAEAFSAYLRAMAETVNVPVSLMLDHGSTVEQCQRAISYGFTDVMYDGSNLSLAENIINTREVVRMAHEKGVGVEGELGCVGSAKDYEDMAGKGLGFTDPENVRPFVEDTGVDYLAVAFGTAHGIYKSEPNLDLNLLKTIFEKVNTPLVMHGGSGLTEAQFKNAIKAGISKINIATNLVIQSTIRMKTEAENKESNLFSIMKAVSKTYSQEVGYYLDLFDATGHGA